MSRYIAALGLCLITTASRADQILGAVAQDPIHTTVAIVANGTGTNHLLRIATQGLVLATNLPIPVNGTVRWVAQESVPLLDETYYLGVLHTWRQNGVVRSAVAAWPCAHDPELQRTVCAPQ